MWTEEFMMINREQHCVRVEREEGGTRKGIFSVTRLMYRIKY